MPFHELKKRLLRDRRFIRLYQAFALAISVPLGWMLIQFATLPYFDAYMNTNSGVFIYMGSVTLLAFSVFGWHAGIKENAIATLSYEDPLTHNYNIQFLREQLTRLFAYSRRMEQPLSLALIDIDHFSDINEDYTYELGDVVLHSVGQTLRNSVRESDIVARVTGDIFCILMPSTDQAQSKHLVERLQQRLAHNPISIIEHSVITVSCSFGVVSSNNLAVTTPQEFFRTADSALIFAQEKGTNQVEMRNI